MVLASTVVASMSAQTHSAGHLRVVDAPSFSALPHAVLFDRSISRDAVVLYAVLQSHWWQGGECFASHATLAMEMRVSERMLRRYLDELIKAKHITEALSGSRRSKTYRPTAIGTTCPIEEVNRTPVSVQSELHVRSNRNEVSDSYKKTPEKKKQEEETPIGGGADAPRRPRKGTSERRASRLADDAALTDEHVQAAEAIGLSRTAAGTEWAQFKDYHRAKGSTMLDWLAAWRTWCRNSLKFGARQKPTRGAKTQDTETPLKPTDMSRWSVRRYP